MVSVLKRIASPLESLLWEFFKKDELNVSPEVEATGLNKSLPTLQLLFLNLCCEKEWAIKSKLSPNWIQL